MRRVLFCLGKTVAGGVAFACLVFAAGLLQRLFEARGIELSDFHVVTAVGHVAVLIGAVLLIIPFMQLFYALLDLGSDEVAEQRIETVELRLKSGARWILTPISFGFAILSGWLATLSESSLVGIAVFGGFALISVWSGFWVWNAKIRFDDKVLLSANFLGRVRRYDWKDLEKIESDDAHFGHTLCFKNRKIAKITYLYAGVDHLMIQAQEALYQNA